MPAPTIATESVNGISNTSADATFVFATHGPSGIAAGSLLLAWAASGFSGSDFANSSAWDKSAENIGQVGVVHNTLTLFSRLSDGSDTGLTITSTPDSTNFGQVSKVLRLAGHAPSGFIHKVQPTTSGSNVSTLAVAGVTTEVPDCLVFYVVACGGVRTFTQSAGVSELYEFATSAPSSDESICICTMTKATPGATGTITFTPSSTSTMVALCVAIRPPWIEGWGEIPIN